MSSSRENRGKSPSKCLAPARSPIVPTIFGIPASLGVVPTQSQVPPLAGGEARLGWAVMAERWLSTTDWTLHLQIYSSCQSFWFSIQQHSMKELERETHVCVHAHRPHTRTQAPHTHAHAHVHKENFLTKQKQYFQNLLCFQTISIKPLIHFDLFPSISRLTLLSAFIVPQE